MGRSAKAYFDDKRAAGLCEYMGCREPSSARRCFKHAREHAARMSAYRLSKKLESIACACGLTLARVEAEGGQVECPHYKSGEHVFPVGRKQVPEGLV